MLTKSTGLRTQSTGLHPLVVLGVGAALFVLTWIALSKPLYAIGAAYSIEIPI